jgi:hypothetical protein
VNNPRASRAMDSANAENPLPLYFPCHRIIPYNGDGVLNILDVVALVNIIFRGG